MRRLVRAVRYAVTDPRIPKPLRWVAAFGLLPIPGPVDEIVLLLVAVPIVLFYRRPLRDAWRRSGIPEAAPAVVEICADTEESTTERAG